MGRWQMAATGKMSRRSAARTAARYAGSIPAAPVIRHLPEETRRKAGNVPVPYFGFQTCRQRLSHACRRKGEIIDSITFTVPGQAEGKGRPRSTRARKKPFTPTKTLLYERKVRSAFLARFLELDGEPLKGEESLFGKSAIEADLTAFLPAPKRLSRKMEWLIDHGFARPKKKPDADNIAKAILDALNTLAYDDDAQVVDLHVRKRFCRQGEEHVDVTLAAIGEDA